jgi:predicted nucleic acid-binding protein
LLISRPASIDTCTLINILASGAPDLVLGHLSSECLISEAVSSESLFLRSQVPGAPVERIDLKPLIETGILTVCQAETPDEEELYVQLASELDDGEALSLAISALRGHAFVTDDRKATRIAKQLGLVDILSTPDLLFSCPDIDIRTVLRAIEFRARFVPSEDHPLWAWWSSNRS